MYLGYQNEKIKFYLEQVPEFPEFSELCPDVEWVETKDEYILSDDTYVLKDKAWEEKEKQKERERLDMLSLTAADVERAIYKAKGIDFEDIIELVKDNPDIDIKALKIEFKANNFYRGNPYISQIGALLGYTSDDLDYLFENKELPIKIEVMPDLDPDFKVEEQEPNMEDIEPLEDEEDDKTD